MTLKVARATLKMYNEGKVKSPSSRNARTKEINKRNFFMLRFANLCAENTIRAEYGLLMILPTAQHHVT